MQLIHNVWDYGCLGKAVLLFALASWSGMFCLVGAVLFNLASANRTAQVMVVTATVGPVASLTAQEVSPPTVVPRPQPTSVPATATNTPKPALPTATPVPLPTATPVRMAPSFAEIRNNMKAMTEAQFNQYSRQLKGARVEGWTGWVEEVNEKWSGGYELWVDMDAPDETFSVQDVTFDIPDDLALSLRKDERITFSGTIDSVSEVLGSLQVDLVDATVER